MSRVLRVQYRPDASHRPGGHHTPDVAKSHPLFPALSSKPAMTAGSRLLTGSPTDVQARRPAVHVSLSRVGVTGVRKVVRIRANGSEQLFYAELDCFVDLGPKQKGAHMSRFEEVIEEAIEEVVLGEAFKAETLAAHIAEHVRERQQAALAAATLAARYPEH